MGDKWRERGLGMMMGGKLEIYTEDELFKVGTGGFERNLYAILQCDTKLFTIFLFYNICTLRVIH